MVTHHQSGVTLIELMIIVVIIGVVALAATPFTSAWIDEARVNEAKTILAQGHAHAKAVALRNPENERDNDVAAGFKLVDGSTLLVCRGDPVHAQCATGGSRVTWQSSWPTGVSTSVTSVAINNRGQALVGGNPVNAGVAFTLSKGSVSTDNDHDAETRNRLR